MNTFTLKPNNVNSKILFNDITEFINSIISEFSILWDTEEHRDAILEVLEEFLEDVKDHGRITQYNVICDGRNNNAVSVDAGITYLDIRYKQDDCYNTTSLNYAVTQDSEN